jgi:hypothetical protein
LRAFDTRGPFDLVITDMGRSEDGEYRRDAGLRLIQEVRARGIDTPIIVFASVGAVAQFTRDVIEAGGQGMTDSATELLTLIQTTSEARFELQVEALLRALHYEPTRPRLRGAPDLLTEVGGERVGIEVKAWRRAPSAVELQRLVDRLITARRRLDIARIIVVSPTPIMRPPSIAEGERLEFTTPSELSLILGGK